MQPPPATPPNSNSVRRVVLASFIGTTIEWYDFFLYLTAASVVFPAIFFPSGDKYAAVMASYAANAVGFLARPLGGMIFSHLGDRVGRKSVLVTTLVLMGVATCLIGLLPTYQMVGIWAPIMLVTLRCVQGFGVGGEWGGAVLMAVEHGKEGKRGLYASWVQAGVPVGGLLAAGVFTLFTLLPEKEFLAWGWRVPFLLGILLLAVGLFIRLAVYESPVFEKVKQEGSQVKMPVLEAIRRHPKNVGLAMGARFAENACFYIFTAFVIVYVTKHLGLDKTMVLNGVLLGYAVQLVAIPIFGGLSDRIGRRPVYLAGAGVLLIFPFVFFALLETKSQSMIWLAIILGLIVHAAMYGPQAAFFSELFGTKVRFSGASLGYQLASPLAGGLAPLIATALLERYHASWPISVYLVVMAAITLVCVFLARETHRKDLEEG